MLERLGRPKGTTDLVPQHIFSHLGSQKVKKYPLSCFIMATNLFKCLKKTISCFFHFRQIPFLHIKGLQNSKATAPPSLSSWNGLLRLNYDFPDFVSHKRLQPKPGHHCSMFELTWSIRKLNEYKQCHRFNSVWRSHNQSTVGWGEGPQPTETDT